MPCTITRDEELYYERESNKQKFGKSMTDSEVLTAILCKATKLLDQHGLVSTGSPLLQSGSRITKSWIARQQLRQNLKPKLSN